MTTAGPYRAAWEREADGWGADSDKPIVRAMFERAALPHHVRHPDDLNIPRRRGICRTLLAKKDRSRDIKKLHGLVDKQDVTKAYKHSRKVIQSVAHDYMIEFWLRRDSLTDGDDTIPPLDDEGQVIDYPSGRGGGKIAIVDWLMKYNALYHERKEQNKLTRSINQTTLN